MNHSERRRVCGENFAKRKNFQCRIRPERQEHYPHNECVNNNGSSHAKSTSVIFPKLYSAEGSDWRLLRKFLGALGQKTRGM
jgi:hypothetical protein